MGTIEPEGTAGTSSSLFPCFTLADDGTIDVYCYSCDDAKLDPLLAKHLGNFGIEVASQTKTEKSMTELVRPSKHRDDSLLTDLRPAIVAS